MRAVAKCASQTAIPATLPIGLAILLSPPSRRRDYLYLID